MTMASQIARHHHEKYDGTGYPDRLIGDQIPLVARISAVADVFDALTHARCYKRAWSVSEAVAEMAQQRSVHFDPLILDAFMSQLKDLIAEHGEAGLDPVLSAHSRGNQLVAAREFLSTQIARQAH
jgi:putative two-component system response regulator